MGVWLQRLLFLTVFLATLGFLISVGIYHIPVGPPYELCQGQAAEFGPEHCVDSMYPFPGAHGTPILTSAPTWVKIGTNYVYCFAIISFVSLVFLVVSLFEPHKPQK